jgi:hypothetical protein
MENYAEELAYWYLRLNGFFLIENFVIHKEPKEFEGIKHRSDADLLAVRFPNVIEKIGEEALRPDDEFLLRNFDCGKTLGLIIEVKSGEDWKNLNIFEDKKRMKYALNRFGFIPPEKVDKLSSDLNWMREDIGDGYQIGKLLIHDLRELPRQWKGKILSVKLSALNTFIENRFKEIHAEKFASRLFFPSAMMQFKIWQVERNYYPND